MQPLSGIFGHTVTMLTKYAQEKLISFEAKEAIYIVNINDAGSTN